jgi:nucleotide-binding universal stress UspA family protein
MLGRAVDDAGRVHPGVVFVPVVVEGRAADVLVEASRGADLLAVGSRGHGEVAGLLVGSVSEHCATHAHSPVLVVRDRQ